MAEYVRVPIDAECALIVEVPASAENELVEAGRTETLSENALTTFESTLDAIRAAAQSAIASTVNMDCKPSEVTVEFGVQLAAQAGVVIAATSASANMRVAFKWTDQANTRHAT